MPAIEPARQLHEQRPDAEAASDDELGDGSQCRFADRAPPTEADCERREEYNEEEYRNLATRLCASRARAFFLSTVRAVPASCSDLSGSAGTKKPRLCDRLG